MDTVIQVAVIGIGVCLLPVFLLVGLYSTNVLWRVVRHWDTSQPPPQSLKGKLLGQELEIVERVEQVSEGLAKTVDDLQRRIKILERERLRGLLKELATKRRRIHGKQK